MENNDEISTNIVLNLEGISGKAKICRTFLERCNICARLFPSNEKLLKHMKLHRIYICVCCGEKSDRPMDNHCQTKIPCSKCKRQFSSTKKRDAHEKKHHHDSKNRFQCDECLETFSTKKLLGTHSKKHFQRFFIECDFCETICDDEDSLKEHLKTHAADKTDKSEPAEKLSLKEHLKTHAADKTEKSEPVEKPKKIKCKSCRRIFCDELRLKRHSVICSLQYTCDKCRWNYKTKENLRKHLCSMKDVVYKCNVCNEAFDKKDDLFKHFFVHKSTQGIDLDM